MAEEQTPSNRQEQATEAQGKRTCNSRRCHCSTITQKDEHECSTCDCYEQSDSSVSSVGFEDITSSRLYDSFYPTSTPLFLDPAEAKPTTSELCDCRKSNGNDKFRTVCCSKCGYNDPNPIRITAEPIVVDTTTSTSTTTPTTSPTDSDDGEQKHADANVPLNRHDGFAKAESNVLEQYFETLVQRVEYPLFDTSFAKGLLNDYLAIVDEIVKQFINMRQLLIRGCNSDCKPLLLEIQKRAIAQSEVVNIADEMSKQVPWEKPNIVPPPQEGNIVMDRVQMYTTFNWFVRHTLNDLRMFAQMIQDAADGLVFTRHVRETDMQKIIDETLAMDKNEKKDADTLIKLFITKYVERKEEEKKKHVQ